MKSVKLFVNRTERKLALSIQNKVKSIRVNLVGGCRMSLNTMTLTVTSSAVYTSQGVNITVTGIAQVSIVSTVLTFQNCFAK